MKKHITLALTVVLIAWIPMFIGAWDSSLPADSSAWNDAAGFIRDNWDALEDGTAPINFRSCINVKHPDYGAVGDSATDDTTAIQAAIDAAHATRTGGSEEPVVYIPGSQYHYMVSNLTIYNGTTLIGDGPHHSILSMIAGSTGVMIGDSGTAVGTKVCDLSLYGNACTADGIDLGQSSTPLGSYGGLWNLYVTNFAGWGIKIHGNAAHLETLEVTNCDNGIYFDGSGNHARNIFVGASAIGIDMTAALSHLSGLHFEGNHSIACIRVQGDGDKSIIQSVDCYVGSGITVKTVIEIESGAGQIIVQGLVVSIAGGTLTGGAMITDETLAYDRIVVNTSTYAIESYMTGLGYVSRTGLNAPPTEGTWVNGDTFFNANTVYGASTGWACITQGTPGTWESLGTSPGYIDKTATYSVLAVDTGKRFSNTGASGGIEFDLPADQEHLEFEFTKDTNQAVTIDPSGTDNIQGLSAGVALTLTNVGDSVKISWLNNATWRTQYYDATIYVP